MLLNLDNTTTITATLNVSTNTGATAADAAVIKAGDRTAATGAGVAAEKIAVEEKVLSYDLYRLQAAGDLSSHEVKLNGIILKLSKDRSDGSDGSDAAGGGGSSIHGGGGGQLPNMPPVRVQSNTVVLEPFDIVFAVVKMPSAAACAPSE